MIVKRGIAHLLVIGVVAIFLLVLPFLVLKFVFKKDVPFIDNNQEPKVELKTEYSNPLKKESQYVNPFDQYKSPFLTLNERNYSK